MTSGHDFLNQLRNDLADLPVKPHARPRRRLWLAISPIALAVLVAGPVFVLARGGSSTVPAASAATFLNSAADQALAAPAARLGPGQFYYEKYHGTDLGPLEGAVGTSEQWMTRLGTGRLLYDGHQVMGFTGSAAHPAATSFGNRGLTYAQLQALPTDPNQLGSVVRQASLPAGPIGLSAAEYRTIGQLLDGSPWPIPPRLRAALLRVAATIPGLTVEEGTRDCANRAATAVVEYERGYANDEPVRMRFELFFNPTTDLFLGERGTVIGRTQPFRCIALLRAGVVDAMTARP
jgi:hypothetical protein